MKMQYYVSQSHINPSMTSRLFCTGPLNFVIIGVSGWIYFLQTFLYYYAVCLPEPPFIWDQEHMNISDELLHVTTVLPYKPLFSQTAQTMLFTEILQHRAAKRKERKKKKTAMQPRRCFWQLHNMKPIKISSFI